MHKLESLIGEWRVRMKQCESVRAEDIEELEQHLLESVEALGMSGLSAEEAFLIAEKRLGNPGKLATEFSKTNGSHVWTQRVFWMVAGHILALAVTGCIGVLMSALTFSGSALTGNTQLASYAGPAFAVAVWIAVLWALVRTAKGQRTPIHWLATTSNRFSSVKLIAIATGAVLLAKGLHAGTNIATARLVGPEELGRMAIVNFYFSMAWGPIFVIVAVTFMAMLRRELRTSHA